MAANIYWVFTKCQALDFSLGFISQILHKIPFSIILQVRMWMFTEIQQLSEVQADSK